jgi:hypothetical protein
MAKKKNTGPFVMLFRDVINSFAWRALSNGARLVIYRVAEEWMAHGGTMNANLPVQKTDFIAFGLDNEGVAPAQREACALGLLMQTKRGRAGNAEFRASHEWGLPFLKDKQGKYLGTDWKRFGSLKEAKAVAKEARAFKDINAVEMGKKHAARRKKIIQFPVRESRTETSSGVPNRKPSKAG